MDDSKNTVDEKRKQTMLFAQLVEILTQNTVMLLGAMPDRQGHPRPPDLRGAEMMIEMLSVLHKKTKGNLTPEEEKMISGTLYQLQVAFAEVASKSGEFGKARKATEAAESGEFDELPEEGPEIEPEPAPAAAARGPSKSGQPSQAQGIQSSASQTGESKVKFTKKYG